MLGLSVLGSDVRTDNEAASQSGVACGDAVLSTTFMHIHSKKLLLP